MEKYVVEKIKDGFYAIDDELGDSMYLIIGSQQALLVDTGMGSENILPLIQSLTSLPCTLVLTHAHPDHMYYADQFESVYVHENEIKYWHKGLSLVAFMLKKKKYEISKFQPLKTGDVLDLGGGVKVLVMAAFGHTPGSIALVDTYHETVMMGDAIGSGAGAWMWLPATLHLSQYRDVLKQLVTDLKPYTSFQFFGGHRGQALFEGATPLAYETIKDMITLCDLVLDKKIEPESTQKMYGLKLLNYKYQSAGFLTHARKIK